MKKLIALSLLSSSIFLITSPVKGDDYDAFGVDYSGDASLGHRIYGVDSFNGNKTLLTTKQFDDNNWNSNNSFVSATTGELIIRSGGSGYHAYNWTTNTWRDPSIDNGLTIFEMPTAQGRGSNNALAITNDGKSDLLQFKSNEVLTNDGETIISKKANGELHIGKNSWITKEENGKQKVWAKDADGNSIPIDYSNGTKLLINGRDVEQSINNIGALSAALTGLPTVPTDTTLACGFGTGTHGGDFAFAGGCASKVNEKLSINYAASMTMPGQDYAGDFEDTFSARAGFVWKLGKSNKPTMISMNTKEKMEVNIDSLEEKNKKLENTVSTLMAKLERLEKVALGKSKSKDLANIKLP